MRMIFSTFLLLAVVLAALAASLPPLWSERAEHAYVHEKSGAVCPVRIEGFSRVGIAAAGTPDLGICSYADAQGRQGRIRVREYTPGKGETPMAIRNDLGLMNPAAVGLGEYDVVWATRGGPGPKIGNMEGTQVVMTMTHGGLLIDCTAWQLASDATDTYSKFGLACMKFQPDSEKD